MTRKDGPIGDDELEGLFGLGDWPLALAVSGGADSMALMHTIARWAARESVKARWTERRQSLLGPPSTHLAKRTPPDRRGLAAPCWLNGIASFEALEDAGGLPHVVVLTVDHGLRPEAVNDAAFVAEEARRLGLPCEILRWHGQKPATGIQEAARDARRDLMLDCLRAELSILVEMANGSNRKLAWHAERVLVLAHHIEDQAETFIMRLARGSGLEGLAGMRMVTSATRDPTSDRPTSFAAQVRRPFLKLSKARLLDTLRVGGHTWVEDKSNADQRFERVRIRKALAMLGEVGLTSEKIALSARRLRQAEESFGPLIGMASRGLQRASSPGLLAELSLLDAEMASPYLAARTLRVVIGCYGGSAREPELAQVEGLVADIWQDARRSSFAGVTLGGCKIEVVGDKRDRVCIYREGRGDGLPVVPLVAGDRFEWDGGRFDVDVQSWFKPGATLAALGMAGWAGLKKAVPELAELGWPAAAAATLPAVVRDGLVVDVPGLYGLIDQFCGTGSPASSAWKAHMARLEPGVYTTFTFKGSW